MSLSWLNSPFCICIVCSSLLFPFAKNCKLSSFLHVWPNRKSLLLKKYKTPTATQKELHHTEEKRTVALQDRVTFHAPKH